MPPISCSVSSSPVRVGFISTFSMVMSEPGTMSAGDQREAGRGGVARHRDRLAGEFALAFDADMAHAALGRSRLDRLAPKPFSIFSVWSRVITGSMTVVMPGVFSPASSTADFTCAEAIGTR